MVDKDASAPRISDDPLLKDLLAAIEGCLFHADALEQRDLPSQAESWREAAKRIRAYRDSLESIPPVPSARTVTRYRVIACGRRGELYTSVDGSHTYADFPAETTFILASEVDPLLHELESRRFEVEYKAKLFIDVKDRMLKTEAALAAQDEEKATLRAMLDNLTTRIKEKMGERYRRIVDDVSGDISVNTAFACAIDEERGEHRDEIDELREALAERAQEIESLTAQLEAKG